MLWNLDVDDLLLAGIVAAKSNVVGVGIVLDTLGIQLDGGILCLQARRQKAERRQQSRQKEATSHSRMVLKMREQAMYPLAFLYSDAMSGSVTGLAREDLRMPLGRNRAAWIELLAVTGLLFSYIWIWQGLFEGDFVVCLGLFLVITIWGHRRRGESARDLGFRLDNLRESARLVFSYVAPLILLMVVIGLSLGLNRELPTSQLSRFRTIGQRIM